MEICSAVREALVRATLVRNQRAGMGVTCCAGCAAARSRAPPGPLALALADGPVKAVEVAYGARRGGAATGARLGARGALAAMNAGP